MALSEGQVSDGQTATAAQLNQLINLLEGGGSETLAFLLKASSGDDFIIKLSDASGARKFSIQDSAGVEQFSVDSDGAVTITGTITPSGLVIPSSAAPTPTAEGDAQWDSDDDFLLIGDASGQKNFFPSGKGSDLTAASSITVTSSFHDVTGTTTITALVAKPAGYVVSLQFDSGLQVTHNDTTLALADKLNYNTVPGDVLVLVSEGSGNWREIGRTAEKPRILYSALGPMAGLGSYADDERVGLGWTIVLSGSGNTLAASTGVGWHFRTSGTQNSDAGAVGPSYGPVEDWTFDTHANLELITMVASDIVLVGGITSIDSFDDQNNIIAFRISGTGNIFAVTDDGGTETATDTGISGVGVKDLRILVRGGGTTVLFFIGGVLKATHTTNIPSGVLRMAIGLTNAGAASDKGITVANVETYAETTF